MLTARNEAKVPRIRLGRSDLDAGDEGKTKGGPDAARLGHLGAAGGRRHPRMRGAWLGAGLRRSASAGARVGYRKAGATDGISPEAALAGIRDVLDLIGDTCPERPAGD